MTDTEIQIYSRQCLHVIPMSFDVFDRAFWFLGSYTRPRYKKAQE